MSQKEQKPKRLDRTPVAYRVKSKDGSVTCAGIEFGAKWKEVHLDPHGSAYKALSGHHQLVVEKVTETTATPPASSEKAAD